MSDEELKKEFAFLFLKLGNPFKASMELFPDNLPRALRVANEWPADPIVKAAQNEIEQSGDSIHSKESIKTTLTRSLLKVVENEEGHISPEDIAKCSKVLAEIHGLIEKPQTNINTHVGNVNRVMVVRENGSNEDWEAGLKKQQERLTNASTRH